MSKPFRHPKQHLLAKVLNHLLNNQSILSIRRKLLSALPFMKMKSDVTDVVYLNWLVDVASIEHLIPPGVVIKQKNGRTLFTILTYQHHHFAPIFLGPLKKLFPSPLQSNWRFYVEKLSYDASLEGSAVIFTESIMDSSFYSFAIRMTSDALPLQLAENFIHQKQGDVYETKITSGIGNAPALYTKLSVPENENELSYPKEFDEYFGDQQEALSLICLQEGGICQIADSEQLSYAGIGLPIDINKIKPLSLQECNIPFLQDKAMNASDAFCFVVPEVPFTVLWERIIKG